MNRYCAKCGPGRIRRLSTGALSSVKMLRRILPRHVDHQTTAPTPALVRRARPSRRRCEPVVLRNRHLVLRKREKTFDSSPRVGAVKATSGRCFPQHVPAQTVGSLPLAHLADFFGPHNSAKDS